MRPTLARLNNFAMVDKDIVSLLQKIRGHSSKGAANCRPYLLADHLAVQRIGPQTLKLVKDNEVTWVDNPATTWVLNSFKASAPASDGAGKRAANASKIIEELAGASSTPEYIQERQKAIGDRIDKRKKSAADLGIDPDHAAWFDTFRSEWDKRQPEEVIGSLDYEAYPDSPASPSPKRYLNSFLSLIDALPKDAEVLLLSGSPAVVSYVCKFTEDEGHVHTVLVDKSQGLVQQSA